MADNPEPVIPDTVPITQEQVQKYWPVFVKYLQLDRRFTPSQIANEPDEMLETVAALDSIYNIIASSVNESRMKAEKARQEFIAQLRKEGL